MPTGNDNKPANKANANRATSIRFERHRMVLCLADGRELSMPLEKYPTLLKATPRQRDGWELLGGGTGIYWNALDLDLSVGALLHGLPERIPKPPSLKHSKRVAPSLGLPRRMRTGQVR